MSNYDVVVLGAGPGGYVSAIRCAQLGLKVAVVEREHLGGICLNWGCIPTKALLRSAEIYHYMQNAKSYGLSAEKISFDMKAIVERSRGVSKQLSSGIGHLLKKNKIDVYDGVGKLKNNTTIEVSKDGKVQSLVAKNIVIATGARARVLPGFEPDGKFIWTYKEALVAPNVPKKLLVMGSGAIGIEFASFFNTLGADTTVVELLPNIMPVEDEEISTMARKSFEKQGMKILTSTKVLSVKKNKDSVEVSLEGADGKKFSLEVDTIISAVGVVANIENIGLEDCKIGVEKGRIVVNDYCQTSVANVYAIGDVIDGPWLAHKASHEGIIVAEKIAGKHPHKMNKMMIPGCTYAHPQVASVGLTEKKAKELGLDVKIGKFPFIGNGKAIALGETDGLIKTIFNAKTGELVGAHMIGAEVTEMIQGYVVAMNLETTEQELINTVFAHPTLSEMMHESVLSAFGRAIHF
jgi:dihydrolipoamide dehydrogenase